jgi:hypothetical protein
MRTRLALLMLGIAALGRRFFANWVLAFSRTPHGWWRWRDPSPERSLTLAGSSRFPRRTKRRCPPQRTRGPAPLVEVAGIEPASFVALMGLLRAQCAVSLLGLTSHAHKLV